MRRIYLQLPLFLLVVDFIRQAFVCCLVSLCCCNKTKIHPRTNDYSDSDSVSDSVSDSGTRNSPCSYRQPDGNGQFLSRRYRKHSVWLFSCLVKKEQKKKVFPPCIITCTTRLRHKSALSRVDACNAQKKRTTFRRRDSNPGRPGSLLSLESRT